MSPTRLAAAAFAAAALSIVCAVDVPAQGTFHSGGVGHCGGCHATHDDETGGAKGPMLLRGANSTDVCLSCHATGNGNTWGASLASPGPVYGGGSFIFLTEDNLNDAPGGADPVNWIPGDRAGHNVVSPTRGVAADPDRTTAPGGSYPSMHLTCTSCHDPHGKAGHYRLLYGADTGPSISDGYEYAFDAPAPVAIGISLDGPGETRTSHNAYLEGMSDWCESCHRNMHRGGGGGGPPSGSTGDTGGGLNTGPTPTDTGLLATTFRHRTSGQIGSGTRTQYDTYEGTGFYETGEPTASYLPEVPFESPAVTVDFTGPTPNDAQLSCLSCHRAHASSAPSSMRWDQNITTWAEEGVVSGSYPLPNPYDATVGNAQRRLCEKCHGDDDVY